VLHQGDLTYMVVTSGLRGDRLPVYAQICQFLIEGWRNLGVYLDYGQAGRGYIDNPNCFATSTGADLLNSEGAKLIGSAQLKKGPVILQHGSMILTPDEDLYAEVFGELPKVSGQFPSHPEIIAQLTLAASHCFNCDFFEQPLTNQELTQISRTYSNSQKSLI
jgi:lipoate-protein ligase A